MKRRTRNMLKSRRSNLALVALMRFFAAWGGRWVTNTFSKTWRKRMRWRPMEHLPQAAMPSRERESRKATVAASFREKA